MSILHKRDHAVTDDGRDTRVDRLDTIAAFDALHARGTPGGHEPFPSTGAQVTIDPRHALAAIILLVVALAACLTLLVQQATNFAAMSMESPMASSSVPSSASSEPSGEASPAPPGDAPSADPSASAEPSAVPATPAGDDGLINLNTATSEQLESINGVGPVTAANILLYRQSIGAFSSVDELLNVTGIGSKTLDKIRPYVTVR